jgi:hypothetical protein
MVVDVLNVVALDALVDFGEEARLFPGERGARYRVGRRPRRW